MCSWVGRVKPVQMFSRETKSENTEAFSAVAPLGGRRLHPAGPHDAFVAPNVSPASIGGSPSPIIYFSRIDKGHVALRGSLSLRGRKQTTQTTEKRPPGHRKQVTTVTKAAARLETGDRQLWAGDLWRL